MSQQDNNKSNAFFSAFSGGKGGGGGGGTITNATNVGTGIGVFKQIVGSDLEFKTLVEGKGISIDVLPLPTSDDINISLDTNVVGIADGTGWYTFYNSVADGLSALGSGETLTFFTNIVETSAVSLALKDGITLDLNGFTYTLSSNDSTNMFQTPSGFISVKCINGGFYRTNAVQTLSSNGLVFRFNKAFQLNFDNSFVISNDGCAIIECNGKFDGKVFGGLWIGGNATLSYAVDSSVFFTNSIFFSETILNSGTMQNCVIWNPSIEDVYATFGDAGEYYNCTIRGTNGADITPLSKLNNCSVYATTIGVYCDRGYINNCYIEGEANALSMITPIGSIDRGRVQNTSVIARANTPALLNQYSIVSNCYFETTTGVSGTLANTISVVDAGIVQNCTIYNKFDGTSAVGIYIDGDNSAIINNSISMTASGGYCIAGIPQTPPNIAYLSSNVGYGTSALIETTNLTNVQVNTPDLYGNILIG